MRQNSLQKNKVQTGQAGSTGRTRNTGKGHGTRDDNPIADKGKTDRCRTSDSNETRVAEGRCR